MSKMKRIIFLAMVCVFTMASTCFAGGSDKITLKSFGHSAFMLTHGDTSLIFDPFITGNPSTTAKPEDIKCKYVLVTHGHFDHVGDANAIAKRNDATLIGTYELVHEIGEGCKIFPMSIGGTAKFDFGYVRVTPAVHGAGVAGGVASGFIVNFYGKTIYFAGDTALFGDMELLSKLEKIDYAMLPIGDTFTMGPKDAVEAVGMLKPKFVIPMHYNTWDAIKQNPQEFKADVEKRFTDTKVLVVQPSGSIEL